MNNCIFLILTVIFLGSCNHRNSGKVEKSMGNSISEIQLATFINTKWECKVAEGCISSYSFGTNGESIFYSCESEDKYYGNYIVNNDTLYIHNFVTDRDSLLPKESDHRSQEAKYKLILVNGKLKHVERWVYSKANSLWEKDRFNFDDSSTFERVK